MKQIGLTECQQNLIALQCGIELQIKLNPLAAGHNE